MLNIYSVRHINSFDNNHLEDNSGSRKQISELFAEKNDSDQTTYAISYMKLLSASIKIWIIKEN